MKIDRNLNIVMPVDLEGGAVAYVHSTPVSRQTFEAHYRVMGKAFARVMQEGSILSGPRIALLEIRATAKEMGLEQQVEQGLIAEMRRLSNLVTQGSDGAWSTVPLELAVSQGLIDAEDATEVENRVAFFILQSALLLRKERMESLVQMGRLWDAQVVSSTCTEFARTLPTSTAAASSGATAPAEASSQTIIPG